jgi:hypothetical protein
MLREGKSPAAIGHDQASYEILVESDWIGVPLAYRGLGHESSAAWVLEAKRPRCRKMGSVRARS